MESSTHTNRPTETDMPETYTIHCDLIEGGDALLRGRAFTLREAQRKMVLFEMHDRVIYRYYLRRAGR
jgi:hypothetical protein